VGATDFGERDFLITIDDERRGVRGFPLPFPAQSVGIGKRKVGIEQEAEIRGELLSLNELLGMLGHPVFVVGIHKNDRRLLFVKTLGGVEEFGHLPGAERALVGGKSAEHDDNDWSIFDQRAQFVLFAVQSRELEIGGFFTDSEGFGFFFFAAKFASACPKQSANNGQECQWDVYSIHEVSFLRIAAPLG